MASRFSIEAVFGAVDKMTQPIRKMANSNSRFTKQIRKDYAMAARSADRFTNSLNKRANAAMKRTAQVGVAGLGFALVTVGKDFADFDDAIFGATARFKDVTLGTEEASKTMEMLRQTARKTGEQTQFTATEMARALDFFARAGFTSTEAMNSLRSVVDLATVTGEDFASVADWSSDLLGAFGFAALESAEKVAKLKEMNAQLGIATNLANVKMEDLFETLKTVAPVGKQAGASMKEMISITAVLGSAGIKGSLAATALKNAFVRLADSPRKAAAALADLGIKEKDLIDNAGNMKSVTKILELIGKRTKDLGGKKKVEIFSRIFGLRAVAGAANLADNTEEVWKIMTKLSTDPQKKMKELSEFMRKSLGNRIKALGSAATELGFKFFSAFDTDAKGGINSLTEAVRKFDIKPIVDSLKSMFAILSFMFGIIKPFLPTLVTFIALWKGYHAALIAVNVAQEIFNLLAKKNPIGLIITAIALLIPALISVKDNWDIVTLSFKIGLEEIMQKWRGLKLLTLDYMHTLGLVKPEKVFKAAVEERKGRVGLDIMKMERALLQKKRGLTVARARLSTGEIVGEPPVTQREAVTTAIEKKTSEQTLNVRNQSNAELDMGGQRIPTGMTRTLQPSG